VNGFAPAIRTLDLFGFYVDGLPDFVEATGLETAVACNVSGDLKFLPVCIGINTGVDASGGSA
jgi:hypothetical protein